MVSRCDASRSGELLEIRRVDLIPPMQGGMISVMEDWTLDHCFVLFRNPPELVVWERFVNHLHVPGPLECWEWIGSRQYGKDGGYGCLTINRKTLRAHRTICQWLYGELPKRLVIDHIWCSNPPCCNPLHLIPHTSQFNAIRPGSYSPSGVNARKTHCIRGHELTPENTYNFESQASDRLCRPCHLQWKREQYARDKAAGKEPRYRPYKPRKKKLEK